MKVVGTGAPRMLTIRVKACEVPVLREVLCSRRTEVVTAAAGIDATDAGTGAGIAAGEEQDRHDELFVIAKLLDALRMPVAPGQPMELVGPTWLLDPIIRDAASEAAERLSEAVDRFRADRGLLSADQMRSAVDTASACTATLIGLDHAQNHGVETRKATMRPDHEAS